MKVTAGWVLALLLVIGTGIAVEGGVHNTRPAGPGTVEGALQITGHLSCPRPPGWVSGCSVSFYPYIRDTPVVIPCTGC